MNIFKKIAAVLALFIGMMSVFAGSRVLLGIDTKDYNVLIWVLSYNVIYGVISIYAAYLIWRDKVRSKYLILFILTSHIIVLLVLKFLNTGAASESIEAMIFRISIWALIVVLSLIIPTYFNKQQS